MAPPQHAEVELTKSREQQLRFERIRRHGESVVHVHPCRGCGEPIFVAWSDTGRGLAWVAFDRNADAPVVEETYYVTATKMRLVRKQPGTPRATYWPHDCANPAFGVGAQAARAQTAGDAM